MKNLFLAMSSVLLMTPAVVHAQDDGRNSLSGGHVGIDVVRNTLKARQPTSARTADRKGVGVRGHIGYDAVVGNFVLIGGELGLGTGGKTVDQASLVGGRYKINPGLTYDATARLGISPANGMAFYGRAGYRGLRFKESVTGQAAGNFSRSRTERGFTYGGGAEFALSEGFSFRTEYNHTKFSPTLKQKQISVGAAIRF